MIWPAKRKKWLIFGDDPVLDMTSITLFHFPHRCGIDYFRRFITISHTVTGQFS